MNNNNKLINNCNKNNKGKFNNNALILLKILKIKIMNVIINNYNKIK